MKKLLPIILVVLTVVLVAVATIQPDQLVPAKSPDGAVQALLTRVKTRDYKGAYSYVAKNSDTDQQEFARDLMGRNGSLRSYSSLQRADTKVLRSTDNEA